MTSGDVNAACYIIHLCIPPLRTICPPWVSPRTRVSSRLRHSSVPVRRWYRTVALWLCVKLTLCHAHRLLVPGSDVARIGVVLVGMESQHAHVLYLAGDARPPSHRSHLHGATILTIGSACPVARCSARPRSVCSFPFPGRRCAMHCLVTWVGLCVHVEKRFN